MNIDKIAGRLDIPSNIVTAEEKQIKSLQFLKKIKMTGERGPLMEELAAVLSDDPECGENIYYQLLHSDLVSIRRFALDFYLKVKRGSLKNYIKNIILLEEDPANLAICLAAAAGTIDRSELQAFFNETLSLKKERQSVILEFLKKECGALSIDYNRMLENAKAMREQERRRRLERYEKKSDAGEGLTIAGELSKSIHNPFFLKYSMIALISLSFFFIFYKTYVLISNARIISGALNAIDKYNEGEAETALYRFCSEENDEIEARFHLHRLYCENYNILEANQIFLQMLALNPASPFTLCAEIRNAIFSSDLKTAAALAAKLPPQIKGPAADDVRYLKIRRECAAALLAPPDKAEYERIYSQLEMFLKENASGYRPYVINLMITSAAAGGFFERARNYYIETLKNHGGYDLKTQLTCAYFAERSGSYAQALELFGRAARAKNVPETISRYAASCAGRLALIMQKYETALDYFLKLRLNGAADAGVYAALIETYGELGDTGGLNSIYKEAITKFENNYIINYSFGVAKMKMNEYEEAIKALKKAINIDVNKAEAYYNIGRSLCAIADKIEAHSMPWNKLMDEAGRHYIKCLELDEKYHDAFISLGTLDLSKNPPDYNGAEKNFTAALKINEKSKEALFNLLSLAGLKADLKMREKYRNFILTALDEDEDAMKRLKNYETTN